MLNMDMIGRIQNDKLYVGGVGTGSTFQAVLAAAQAKSTLHTDVFSRRLFRQRPHFLRRETNSRALLFFRAALGLPQAFRHLGQNQRSRRSARPRHGWRRPAAARHGPERPAFQTVVETRSAPGRHIRRRRRLRPVFRLHSRFRRGQGRRPILRREARFARRKGRAARRAISWFSLATNRFTICMISPTRCAAARSATSSKSRYCATASR